MHTLSYRQRRGELRTYFDRTAADAWARLTSDAPVSGIRATVRKGRDQMRSTLLSWLPDDLSGRRVLDAGCGTGALAVEAAKRGADVVAIDLAETLVTLARDRASDILRDAPQPVGTIDFRVGDMLDPDLGRFDHVVGMDSLIHYRPAEMVGMISRLADIADTSVVFTFAPRTPILAAMHAVGRIFPRSDRAPAIEPIDAGYLKELISDATDLGDWRIDRTHRIDSGFYMSQAMEIRRA